MKNYNKDISSSFLMYLDANNPMITMLPIGGFKWDDAKIYTEDIIKSYNINSKYGAVLEVDIEYPKELHKYHSELPFLCERVKLNKTKKLVTTFNHKNRHVIHIAALKQALNHGLKLTKAHTITTFVQVAWMKSYIEKNTKLRMQSKNEFGKNFLKLMNNAVFGKTMGDVRNHRDIKLVTTNEGRKHLVSHSHHHTCK